MTAIVIPVRPGDHNDELRYTLRSIATHVPNPDIWIIGHKPAWIDDVHWIPTHPTGLKSDRGCQQTRAAADHPDTPDSFWWWDDDMYRLTPLDEQPTHHHGGPLTDWTTRYRSITSQYARALHRTAGILPTRGTKMYDLHIPYWVADKTALAHTMTTLPNGVGGWLWRTVHGNRHHIGGTHITDVKIYRDTPIPNPPGDWISSDNPTWTRLRPLLADLLPTPSPWETTRPTTYLATYRRADGSIRRTPYQPRKDAQLIARGWQRDTVSA